MSTNKTTAERRIEKERATEHLSSILKPGDTLFYVVRRARADGSRIVTVHTVSNNHEGKPSMAHNLSYNVAKTIGFPYNDKDMAVVVQEVGTMAQGLVTMNLAQALFKDPHALKHETL